MDHYARDMKLADGEQSARASASQSQPRISRYALVDNELASYAKLLVGQPPPVTG